MCGCVSERERERETEGEGEMGEELVGEGHGENPGEEEEEAEVLEQEVEGRRREVVRLEKWKQKKQTQIMEIAEKLSNGDLHSQILAAREIRRIVRSSSSSSKTNIRSKFAAVGVIEPLISMLSSISLDAREASLLALLNLGVRNEQNKVKIVTSGAIPPLVEFLKFQNNKLPELATAAILTLSAAAPNRPIIASSGAAPLLVKILIYGSIQGKVDAVTALYNLSSIETAGFNLDPSAASPLLSLLKESKKYSKFAEKTTFLLEILSTSVEGRNAISDCCGGILTLVETVEDGSRASMEHAVGALLSLCQSCRSKYRELILNEGAIPGLLRLTVEGTTKAQERARLLLDLLRDTPQDNGLSTAILEEIVYDTATKVDGALKAPESAQKLLQDMLHRSMELSMNRMQLCASSYKLSGTQPS